MTHQRAYPAADAKQFQKMLDASVAAATKAAVLVTEKEEHARDEKMGKGLKASRLPCDCEDADCGNCPQHQQEARKGARGRDSSSVNAELAATEKKNLALRKAEKAVAKSNAILQERVCLNDKDDDDDDDDDNDNDDSTTNTTTTPQQLPRVVCAFVLLCRAGAN